MSSPGWLVHNMAAIKARNDAEVKPFSQLVMNYQVLRDAYTAEVSSGGAGSSSRMVFQAPSAEILDQIQELTRDRDSHVQQNLELKTKNIKMKSHLSEIQRELSESQESVRELERDLGMLKQDRQALLSENKSVHEQLDKTSSDNERLLKELMRSKHNEAEIRQKLFEIEVELLALKNGLPLPKHEEEIPTRQTVYNEGGSSVPDSDMAVPPNYQQYKVDNVHDGELHSLCFSASGKAIWTGGADRCIKCWDSSNGKQVIKIPSAAAPLSLHSVGDMLASGCADSTVRLWTTNSFRGICQLTGHTEKVIGVCLTSDVRSVFSASNDRTIKQWDVQKERLNHTFMCLSVCNDVTSVNEKVASAHHDGTLRLLDSRDCKVAGEIRDLHEKTMTSVRFSSDGVYLATLSRENRIKIIDIRMLLCTATLSGNGFSVGSNWQRLAISNDGRFCAAGSTSGGVYVWSTNGDSNSPRVHEGGHMGHIPAVAWSPDGRGVASLGSDKKLILWK